MLIIGHVFQIKIILFLYSLPFLKFATNEAIQRTEAYEYAQSLGAQTCPLPSFQVSRCCQPAAVMGGQALSANKLLAT